MAWALWSHDTFDRDADPSLEREFDTLAAGLAGLWRQTLREAIDDGGRATFTEFSLRGSTRMVFLPRDPFDNPELAQLRRRFLADEEGFLEQLVAAHVERFEARLNLTTLLCATMTLPPRVARLVDVLAERLGVTEALVVRDGAFHRGLVRATPTFQVASEAWRVEVPGLVATLEGGALSVEATGEQLLVLRDELLEGDAG
jgi:hypothetical protein